ncbi:unnamed protein product [Discosporangium mesarthrocarpum]
MDWRSVKGIRWVLTLSLSLLLVTRNESSCQCSIGAPPRTLAFQLVLGLFGRCAPSSSTRRCSHRDKGPLSEESGQQETSVVRLCYVHQLQVPDIPPPHVFTIPVLGRKICVLVDEKGGHHAVEDAFPPIGIPVSEVGVIDTEVGVVEDTVFGTRFYLSTGEVRGRWCPGGSAGPLLRLSRWTPWRRRLPRQLRVFNITRKMDGGLYARIPKDNDTGYVAGRIEDLGLAGYDH